MSKLSENYLLAVDPSLTCSGWALFGLRSCQPEAVGFIRGLGASIPMSARMEKYQLDVAGLFERLRLGQGDYLICEGPAPLVKNPQSAIKVEGVRGMFETLARGFGLNVPGRVNPRTIQSELMGLRGKQLKREIVKESARITVSRLYGDLQRIRMIVPDGVSPGEKTRAIQDIVDALLIGTYAVKRISFTKISGESFNGSTLKSFGQ